MTAGGSSGYDAPHLPMKRQSFGLARSYHRGSNISASVALCLAAIVAEPACSPATGSAGSGGSPAGGSSSGGAGVTGGSVGSGGAPGSGGLSPSGGSTSGGASSGGASSGGGSSGGAASGGSGTGGGASGGAPGSGGGGGFQPCPATGPCRILPLGDSITDGLIGGGSGTNGGYRVPLFSISLTEGKDITFVGTRMNGPDTVDGQPFPKGHEGESGIKIEALSNKTFLFDGDPNIVLLHIGTNDLFQNEASGAPDRLESFIDEILAAMPDGLLVVAKLIPLPARESDLTTYNAAVAALVEEKAQAGAHILLADQFTGFPEDTELPDGIHPNAAGYERMAGVWYDVIEPYLP